MKNGNLILHCGAGKVERAQVETVATPEATDSWFPIPHVDAVNRIEKALAAANMRITEEAHSLTRDGNRYFGLFGIANGVATGADYSYVLGVRNSHDKSFPFGLVVGASVFVCDNLSFSGEIKIARKHTRFIERDLPALTTNAIGLLSEKWTLMSDRIAKYKVTELGERDVHDFVIRSVDAGAATVQQIPGILKEWREPRHPEFAEHRNAWRLFNAFTETAKESSLALLPKRTISLHALMDGQCGFAFKGADDVTAGTVDSEAIVARN